MIYIQLEEEQSQKENEEYVCKVAKTVEDAKQVIEAGFEYVCEIDGARIFRKRK